MPPQNPNQFVKVPPDHLLPKPRGHHFLLIITFLLLLTGAFGVWYFLNPAQELEPENLSVTPKSNEFADWKTYRNEKYGFEIKYPKEFITYTGFKGEDPIEATPKSTEFWIALNNGILRRGEPVTLGVEIFKSKETLENWLNKNKEKYSDPSEIQYTKNTTLSGQDALEMAGGCNLGSVCRMYLLRLSSDNLVVITVDNDDSLDQILSAFKFISTSTTSIIDTSNWKKGGGDALGFTILIPQTARQELRPNPQTEPHGDFYIENSTKNLSDYFYLEINKKGFPFGLNDSWSSERINVGGSEVIVNVQYTNNINSLVYLFPDCEKGLQQKCWAFYGQGNKDDGWNLLLKTLANFKQLY